MSGKEASNKFGLDPAKAKEVTFTIHNDEPIEPFKGVSLEPPQGKDLGPNIKRLHASYCVPLTGDMEGWAAHDHIMTMSGEGDKGRADFVDISAGHALFNGTICDRQGTVAIAQWGECIKDKVTSNWTILEETATGDLVGIKGGGTFESPAEPGKPAEGKIMIQWD